MLETVLQAGPCRWLTCEGHLPAAAHTDWPRAEAPGPARTVSGNVADCRGPMNGKKTANFLQMHAKINHVYSTEGHETGDKRTWKDGISHCTRIFRLRWAVSSEIERKRQNNRPGCEQPARNVGLGWRQGRLPVRQWRKGTRTAVTQRARVTRAVIEKPNDTRLRN